MLIKKIEDQIINATDTCGEIRTIIKKGEYHFLGMAIAINIQPTKAHYHNTFDEIYFLTDGNMTLGIYNPLTNKKDQYELNSNELFIISKGLHHKILTASAQNRLCIISVPPFYPDDEHPSDKFTT